MSILTKDQLKADSTSTFPNNNSGQITPGAVRDFNTNMIDSLVAEDEIASKTVASASYATFAATASFLSGFVTSASYASTASVSYTHLTLPTKRIV